VRCIRPTLKEELEYALWKVTGIPLQFNEYVIPYLSQELARKTREDPAVVSYRLIEQIQQIVHEDVGIQMKKCRLYGKMIES
jgi:hypothetical protein